jgi:hypothetical protein
VGHWRKGGLKCSRRRNTCSLWPAQLLLLAKASDVPSALWVGTPCYKRRNGCRGVAWFPREMHQARRREEIQSQNSEPPGPPRLLLILLFPPRWLLLHLCSRDPHLLPSGARTSVQDSHSGGSHARTFPSGAQLLRNKKYSIKEKDLLGVVWNACNPSTQETEAGGWQV